MLVRKSVAVGYCFNRAAECEKLAELAQDHIGSMNYRRLAAAWLRLARNAEFTDELEAHLSGEKPE